MAKSWHRRKQPVKGPLRLVLGTVTVTHRYTLNGKASTPDFDHPFQEELLECGHTQMVRQDIYGEFYSTRRRCSQCRNEKPALFTPEQIQEFKNGRHDWRELIIER